MNPQQKYVVPRPYIDNPCLSNSETELSLELAVDADRRRRSRASKKYEPGRTPSSSVRETTARLAEAILPTTETADEPVPKVECERVTTIGK